MAFLLPARSAVLFRWALSNGMKAGPPPLTLMSQGPYSPPDMYLHPIGRRTQSARFGSYLALAGARCFRCFPHVGYWHKADIEALPANARYWG